jgi:hypothetical protein
MCRVFYRNHSFAIFIYFSLVLGFLIPVIAVSRLLVPLYSLLTWLLTCELDAGIFCLTWRPFLWCIIFPDGVQIFLAPNALGSLFFFVFCAFASHEFPAVRRAAFEGPCSGSSDYFPTCT